MCQPGKPRPQGESHSCCRFSPGFANFHSAKSAGWRLPSHVPDAAAAVLRRELESRQLRVTRELRDVEVDPVRDAVRDALRLERADHLDLLGDVLARLAQHLGLEAVQAAPVAQPLRRVLRGHLGGAAAALARGQLHLVLAGVGVVGEMPDVGDVDDVRDPQAGPEQRAPEQVREDVRPHVPDVLRRVDRRAARVHPRVARDRAARRAPAAASASCTARARPGSRTGSGRA